MTTLLSRLQVGTAHVLCASPVATGPGSIFPSRKALTLPSLSSSLCSYSLTHTSKQMCPAPSETPLLLGTQLRLTQSDTSPLFLTVSLHLILNYLPSEKETFPTADHHFPSPTNCNQSAQHQQLSTKANPYQYEIPALWVVAFA